ncbi:hypothetical protein [Elizabethkingia meningoseptica]|uniref:hypothetical protein n=1 Tax=Elizabethkingia meningoseptica TaxID=238 RepID=UPI0038923694
MKKILLVAAIAVAGLVSAKSSVKNVSAESKSVKKEFVKKTKNAQATKALFYRWGKRISPCGKVYYLDLDGYADASELFKAVDQFDYAKCGYTE